VHPEERRKAAQSLRTGTFAFDVAVPPSDERAVHDTSQWVGELVRIRPRRLGRSDGASGSNSVARRRASVQPTPAVTAARFQSRRSSRNLLAFAGLAEA
jgi:hypothetical protein